MLPSYRMPDGFDVKPGKALHNWHEPRPGVRSLHMTRAGRFYVVTDPDSEEGAKWVTHTEARGLLREWSLALPPELEDAR